MYTTDNYPQIGDMVNPVGYNNGPWTVIDTDYKPDNHNILVKNDVRGEMWISWDAMFNWYRYQKDLGNTSLSFE